MNHEPPEQALQWLDHLRATGRKESTIAGYRNAVNQCFLYLRSESRPTSPDGITPEDVVFLWNAMTVREETRISYLRCLSMYTVHFTGRDVLRQADILRNREVRHRVFIGKEEFALMWMNADPFQRVILALGGMMGLRRAEMAGIRDSDIVDGTLLIHGKGHGDGLLAEIEIPGIVMEEIERYRSHKRGLPNPDSGDGYLLQSPNRRGELDKVYISRISDAVRELGESVGVRATTHSLRRLYATVLYYEAEADAQTVRSLMRHASVSTTFKCYIDASRHREREASRRLEELMGEVIG